MHMPARTCAIVIATALALTACSQPDNGLTSDSSAAASSIAPSSDVVTDNAEATPTDGSTAEGTTPEENYDDNTGESGDPEANPTRQTPPVSAPNGKAIAPCPLLSPSEIKMIFPDTWLPGIRKGSGCMRTTTKGAKATDPEQFVWITAVGYKTSDQALAAAQASHDGNASGVQVASGNYVIPGTEFVMERASIDDASYGYVAAQIGYGVVVFSRGNQLVAIGIKGIRGTDFTTLNRIGRIAASNMKE